MLTAITIFAIILGMLVLVLAVYGGKLVVLQEQDKNLISSLRDQLRITREHLRTADQQIEYKLKEIEVKNDSIDNLEQKVKNLHNFKEHLLDVVEDLKKRLDTIKKENHDKDITCELHNEIDVLRSEINTLKSDLDKAEDKIYGVNQKNSTLGDVIVSLEQRLKNEVDRRLTCEAANTMLRKSVTDLEDRLTDIAGIAGSRG